MAEEVVDVGRDPFRVEIHRPARHVAALAGDHTMSWRSFGHDEFGGDLMRGILEIDDRALRHPHMCGGVRHLGDSIETVRHAERTTPRRACISQGKDPVSSSFALEKGLELSKLFGKCLGEIDTLREVVGDVVQLPVFVGAVELVGRKPDPRHSAVETRSHPAVVVYGAIAEDLEVLRGAPTRRCLVVEGVPHGCAVHRHLFDSVDLIGPWHACSLEDRGRNVDDMMELGS